MEQALVPVAELTPGIWVAPPHEPTLRGPYLVFLGEYGDTHCECTAGRYATPCHHLAAVAAATCGTHPVSAVREVWGPARDGDGPHVWNPPRRVADAARIRDAHSEARRAANPLPRLTPADYAYLFP